MSNKIIKITKTSDTDNTYSVKIGNIEKKGMTLDEVMKLISETEERENK